MVMGSTYETAQTPTADVMIRIEAELEGKAAAMAPALPRMPLASRRCRFQWDAWWWGGTEEDSEGVSHESSV